MASLAGLTEPPTPSIQHPRCPYFAEKSPFATLRPLRLDGEKVVSPEVFGGTNG
jgi:hypothetical protein